MASTSVHQSYNHIVPGVYNPPVTHYTEVIVTIRPDYMKYVIGANGKYFNAITKASGADYIWYVREKNVIEVWGPIHSLCDAAKRLQDRMELIQTRVIKEEAKEQTLRDIEELNKHIDYVKNFKTILEEQEWQAVCNKFSTKNITSWADDEDA